MKKVIIFFCFAAALLAFFQESQAYQIVKITDEIFYIIGEKEDSVYGFGAYSGYGRDLGKALAEIAKDRRILQIVPIQYCYYQPSGSRTKDLFVIVGKK